MTASDTGTQPTLLYAYTKPPWYRTTWFVDLVASLTGVLLTGVAWGVFGPSGDTSRAGTQTSFRFGDWVTFQDGSVLSVSEPEKFQRSVKASGGENSKQFVKVQISFLNRRTDTFDASGADVVVTSDGSAGSRVVQDGMYKPKGKGLPGSRVTWTAGYGVKSSSDVVVDVDLKFAGYGTIRFVSDPSK